MQRLDPDAPVYALAQPDGSSITIDVSVPNALGDFAMALRLPDGRQHYASVYHTGEPGLFIAILRCWASVAKHRIRLHQSGRRRTVAIVENEIELISDGDGIAVIGQPKAVERFLESEGLPSKDLGLPRLSKVLAVGSAGAQAAADVAANSGRWVKLTQESAQKVKQYGLTPTKTPGISHAMIGKPGASRSWLQIEKGPGLLTKNPALLANAPA